MKPDAMPGIVAALTVVLWIQTAGTAGFGAEATVPASPTTSAASVSTNGTGPRIVFVAPVYDFGKVAGGEVVKHEFAFTNAGGRLLQINDVRTSCGCTTPGNWSRQVEPGKGGTIPIEFHTGNFNGPVMKQVTVTSNDTNQPVVALQIKGTVWRPIDVSPQSVVLRFLTGSPSNVFTTVRLVNNQEEPLVLSDPVSNNPGIAAELKTNQAGKEFQLIVRTVPPLGPGNVTGRVTLKTSLPKTPLLEVPVFAIAQQPVTTTPSQLLLPAGPIASPLAQTVSIRSLWTNSLLVSEPTVNAKGVEVHLTEVQPGRYYTLTLNFPKGFAVPQGEKVELSVKSNHPQYPIIKVPVVQQPPPTPRPAPRPAASIPPPPLPPGPPK